MSAAVDWSGLQSYSHPVGLDAYLAMPEDLSRTIEVRDGMIVHCESASPNHNAVAYNIRQALSEANAKRAPSQPCLRVNGDVDMLVSEVPFHFKRPDVIVYRCIEYPRPRWKTKPTVADAVLVVEVVSPSTVTVDLLDKRAEYARYGIPHYWIVRMVGDDGAASSIEMLVLNSAGQYVSEDYRGRATHPMAAIDSPAPLAVRLTWEQLDIGLD